MCDWFQYCLAVTLLEWALLKIFKVMESKYKVICAQQCEFYNQWRFWDLQFGEQWFWVRGGTAGLVVWCSG